MLIHKCRLMIVTACVIKDRFLKIKLNNVKEFKVNNYEGPLFKCGRFAIINVNSKNILTDLYLLDNQNKPFQIYGKFDPLIEGSVIYDDTKELSKDSAYAIQICINAFSCLFKNEIEQFKDLLLELENSIFDFVLTNSLGWKTSKKKVIELLESIELPADLKVKISEQISIAPMPKVAINKQASINLEEYPNSVFVKL